MQRTEFDTLIVCDNLLDQELLDNLIELVTNADIWSYSHRISNGELSDKKQQQAINNAFWKLLDTPETDAVTKERQRKYTEAQQAKIFTP